MGDPILEMIALVRDLAQPGRDQHARVRERQRLGGDLVIDFIDEQQRVRIGLRRLAVPPGIASVAGLNSRLVHVVMLDMCTARKSVWWGKSVSVRVYQGVHSI